MTQQLYIEISQTLKGMDLVGYSTKQMKQTLLARKTWDKDINPFWKRVDKGEFTLHEFMVALRKAFKEFKSIFYQPESYEAWGEEIYNN